MLRVTVCLYVCILTRPLRPLAGSANIPQIAPEVIDMLLQTAYGANCWTMVDVQAAMLTWKIRFGEEAPFKRRWMELNKHRHMCLSLLQKKVVFFLEGQRASQ